MRKKGLIGSLAVAFVALISASLGVTVFAAEGETAVSAFESKWVLDGAEMSTAYSKDNARFTQTENLAVTNNQTPVKQDQTHNQVTTAEYTVPLYVADNGKTTPVIRYSIDPQTYGKRDMDAIIFTLYDENDPTQYVSVMQVFSDTNVENSSRFFAKGTGQTYAGYHAGGSGEYAEGKPVESGTISWAGLFTDTESNPTKTVSTSFEIYYDNTDKTVWVSNYWSSYNSRNIPIDRTNGTEKVMVRDLDDESKLTGGAPAFSADLRVAKLKITTVRGWYSYTDEFGESDTVNNVYQDRFYGGNGSAGKHTLSDKGARYLVRAIDGQVTDSSNGVIQNNGVVAYAAEGVETDGKNAIIPALTGYNVLSGKTEAAEYTQTLYVSVLCPDGTAAEISGSQGGKWAPGCGFVLSQDGEYTIRYCTDSQCEQAIAQYSFVNENKIPDMDHLVYPTSEIYFEDSENISVSHGPIQVNNSEGYVGEIISTTKEGATVFYAKDIDISDNTKDIPLVEFLPLPQTVGVYDFRVLVFKFYNKENPDEYFQIKLQYNGNDPAIDYCYAAGDNQEYYGLKSIRNMDEYDNAAIAQNLAGQAKDGEYVPIGIYYDRQENCVYLSPTWDYRTSVSSGKFKLRDFNDDLELKLYGGASTTEPAWGGFSSDVIGMEVIFETLVSGATAKIGIINVDGTPLRSEGETFISRLEGTVISKGITGYPYEIPEPVYYNAETEKYQDFFSSATAVKVLGPDGEEISLTGRVFVPQTAGLYKIIYGVLEGGVSYGYDLVVEVVQEDLAAPIVLDLSKAEIADGMRVYCGDSLSGTAYASTELYLTEDKSCTVTAILYRDGQQIAAYTDQPFAVDCSVLGNYAIVYTAEDYAGRQLEKEIHFEVVRTEIVFTDPAGEELVADRTDGVPVFGASDIVVQDISVGNDAETIIESKDFAQMQTQIFVSYQDGEFEPYTENYDFSALGNYKIRYDVTYRLEENGTQYASSIRRSLTVIDNTPPVFGTENVVSGIQLNEEKDEYGAIWYKSVLSSEVTVRQETAQDPRKDGAVSLNEITVILTDPEGQKTDITQLFGDSGYSFVTQQVGTYYIVFTVSDGTLSASKTYVIESKNVWLSVAIGELPETIQVGEQTLLPKVVATDYNGTDVTSQSEILVEIVSEGTAVTVEDYRWVPDHTGTVTVRYTVSYGGESVVTEKQVTITDSEPPVISFEGEVPVEGSVGMTVVIPNVVIEDNADPVIGYRVFLSFEGKETELFDLSFIPEKEGVYSVSIRCEDLSGNKAEKTFAVEVGPRKEIKDEPAKGGCASSVTGTGVAVGMMLLAVGFYCMKKREKRSK